MAMMASSTLVPIKRHMGEDRRNFNAVANQKEVKGETDVWHLNC